MPAPRVPVEVTKTDDGGFQLMRGGAPYEVRGAGFHAHLDVLVAAGGNSIRTWGVGPETRALLDEAWDKDVSVALGLWLGHVEHGFDYGDEDAVAEQLARLEREVLEYRDHPALLVWGVGNEVELEGGDDVRIWRAIEDAAKMVKRHDPHHPTMAVTAEIGAANEKRLRELCPSIDIWGINSYGGAPSLPKRLDERGFDGPFMLTEYGGLGDWEGHKHPWGAAHEQTSAEKAAGLRSAYEMVRDDRRGIGSYAFLWGEGDSPTDTWFALFGPTGIRYEGIDTLRELWGGPAPKNRAPTATKLETNFDGKTVPPRAPLDATLLATDPDGDALTVDWVLHRDAKRGSGSGPAVRCERGGGGWSGNAPAMPGAYRVLAVARDDAGGAAHASARFVVERDVAGPGLPIWVDGPFAPSGWMGDAAEGGLAMTKCPPRPGFCGGPCRAFTVKRGRQGWSGVVWQHPRDNWKGDEKGLEIPKDAVAVEFVAWGEKGGESVTFSAGNKEVDGFLVEQRVRLTKEPARYRMSLIGKSWKDVAYGFSWVVSTSSSEATRFYVADVTYVAM